MVESYVSRCSGSVVTFVTSLFCGVAILVFCMGSASFKNGFSCGCIFLARNENEEGILGVSLNRVVDFWLAEG